MAKRVCTECGCEFETNGSRGKPRMFCSEAHKQANANRRASRGKSLVAIAQAWRKTRGSGDFGKFLFMEMSSLLDEWNAQDSKAGRGDPVDYAKALCNYTTVNPDYYGGQTFVADRWMDRLSENR